MELFVPLVSFVVEKIPEEYPSVCSGGVIRLAVWDMTFPTGVDLITAAGDVKIDSCP